jgi:hypothetical protein
MQGKIYQKMSKLCMKHASCMQGIVVSSTRYLQIYIKIAFTITL